MSSKTSHSTKNGKSRKHALLATVQRSGSSLPTVQNGKHSGAPSESRRCLPWLEQAKSWFIGKNFVSLPPLQADELGELARVTRELAVLEKRLEHLDRRRAVIASELESAEKEKYSEDRGVSALLLTGNGLLIVLLVAMCVANGAYLIHSFQEVKNWWSAILMVAPLGLAGLALDSLIHTLRRSERILMGVLLAFALSLCVFGYSVAIQVREGVLTETVSISALREGSSRTIQLVSQFALEICMTTIFFSAVRRYHALTPSRRWQRRMKDMEINQEIDAFLPRIVALDARQCVLKERQEHADRAQRDYLDNNFL